MITKTYNVTGMTCGHCVASVDSELRSVPGVAEVNTWGGDERQIQVVVDPVNLEKRGLTLAGLIEALEANNANAGGGTLDQSGQSYLIQGLGIVTRPEDVGNIVVAAQGGIMAEGPGR